MALVIGSPLWIMAVLVARTRHPDPYEWDRAWRRAVMRDSFLLMAWPALFMYVLVKVDGT